MPAANRLATDEAYTLTMLPNRLMMSAYSKAQGEVGEVCTAQALGNLPWHGCFGKIPPNIQETLKGFGSAEVGEDLVAIVVMLHTVPQQCWQDLGLTYGWIASRVRAPLTELRAMRISILQLQATSFGSLPAGPVAGWPEALML